MTKIQAIHERLSELKNNQANALVAWLSYLLIREFRPHFPIQAATQRSIAQLFGNASVAEVFDMGLARGDAFLYTALTNLNFGARGIMDIDQMMECTTGMVAKLRVDQAETEVFRLIDEALQ